MAAVGVRFDEKRYGRLLAKAVPAVITTKEENDRILQIIESLLAKGEGNLTAEEDTLLDLLTSLVEAFEAKTYPVKAGEPHKALVFLLEARDLKPSALWDVVGSKSRVSEILADKRSISKEQAKKLAAFFRVDVGLFL